MRVRPLGYCIPASLGCPFLGELQLILEQLLQPKGKLLKGTLAQQDAAQTTPPQISFFCCQLQPCLEWGRRKGGFLSLLEMSIKSQNSGDADVHQREDSREDHAGRTNQSSCSGQAGTQREHQGTATFAHTPSLLQAQNPSLSVCASRFQHKGLSGTDRLSCSLWTALQESWMMVGKQQKINK